MDYRELMAIIFSEEQISEKRNEVRNQFLAKSKNIKRGEIKVISEEDLRILYNLYDRIFLNDYFKGNFKEELKFSLSRRMNRNAGKTIFRGNSYEIVMAVNIFFNYETLEREKRVNGICTTDSVNALQLVFEHELCHLIEFYIFKESSCSKARFKTLALNIFGHTDVCHQLPTDNEISREMYGFKIGEKVNFSAEGKCYEGIINAINKRATVMVVSEEGMYTDKYGKRYEKWYVPLEKLYRK